MSAPLPVYVLAGGASRRFGSDKARAELDGEALVVRAARLLAAGAGGPVCVVAGRAGAYDDLGVATVGDLEPGLGPLGGLVTALAHREAGHGPGWIVLGSCDLLELPEGWIETLYGGASGDVDAVAFRHARWEPLPALYHTRLRPLAEAQLAREARSLQALLDAARARALPLAPGGPLPLQANTRAALSGVPGEASR